MDELIKALRRLSATQDTDNSLDWVYGSQQAMHDSADALEAAEKRIAELEAQLPKLPDRQEFLAKGSFIEEPLSRPKEGEWLEQDDGDSIFFKCSVCGKIQYNVLLEMMQGEYHYCPNCGKRIEWENAE